MKRLRKAYHIIIAAVMTFCLISCADNAILSEILANTIVSADEYNSFTYSINNGNASISKYNGTAENLVVPEKINAIQLPIFMAVHFRVIITLRKSQ